MTEILNLLNHNKIDYSSFQNLFKRDASRRYDINIIIPVKGRFRFIDALYQSFVQAKKNTSLKICITIVEISSNAGYKEFCAKNGLYYLNIPLKNPFFNKCIAMNCGALFSVTANSFIFHDLDCLVQDNFFSNLEKNIAYYNAKVLQCFTLRRVLYVDENLSNLIIDKKVNVNEISPSSPGVSHPEHIGAPGGSIYIEKDLFFEVGGYDPELFFGNAPEDAFFWSKVYALEKIFLCDNPATEIFHLHHAKPILDKEIVKSMLDLYDSFVDASQEEKLKIINLKKDLIKEYYYE